MIEIRWGLLEVRGRPQAKGLRRGERPCHPPEGIVHRDVAPGEMRLRGRVGDPVAAQVAARVEDRVVVPFDRVAQGGGRDHPGDLVLERSEERRVGKAWRRWCWWDR